MRITYGHSGACVGEISDDRQTDSDPDTGACHPKMHMTVEGCIGIRTRNKREITMSSPREACPWVSGIPYHRVETRN